MKTKDRMQLEQIKGFKNALNFTSVAFVFSYLFFLWHKCLWQLCYLEKLTATETKNDHQTSGVNTFKCEDFYNVIVPSRFQNLNRGIF